MKRTVRWLYGAALVIAFGGRSDTVLAQTTAAAPLIGFRADPEHVVVTVTVLPDPYFGDDARLSDSVARYGYRFGDPTRADMERAGAMGSPGDAWLIQSGPGRVFQAEVERVVAGALGCETAMGLLLRVATDQAQAFAGDTSKYFIASSASGTGPAVVAPAARSRVAALATPTTAEFRRSLESLLAGLLARELPSFSGSAEEYARADAGGDWTQRWARERRRIDAEMAAGRFRLRYDVQSFRLSEDGVPAHFVRAQWMVGDAQGFAATVWVRGTSTLTMVDANTRAGSWLRMREFEGVVSLEQQGMILGVFDWNGDGRGEVLMLNSGYESRSLSVLEYSPDGVTPTGVEFGGGC